jgi:stalled ribosome alternative rescue factor ArfA
VQARKYLMKIITANMGDMTNKLKAGNIQDIQVNAGSIAAMTIVLPPLYREKYEQAYPKKGSYSNPRAYGIRKTNSSIFDLHIYLGRQLYPFRCLKENSS